VKVAHVSICIWVEENDNSFILETSASSRHYYSEATIALVIDAV